MKKLIFGLLVLVGGVLFLTCHLAQIATESTDKLSINALSKLIATDNQAAQNPPANNAKPAEDKPITQQMATELMKPIVEGAKEITSKRSLSNQNQIESATKPPIATIKIYDKKTNKEIIIETPAQLQAQKKSLTLEEQQEQKDKDDRFRAYYQKSEKCLSPSDPQTRVECGNEYIRAKAKFEEIYKQGKN